MANIVTMFVLSAEHPRSPDLCQSSSSPSVSSAHSEACRISNTLFSLRIIILSRKPITSHS